MKYKNCGYFEETFYDVKFKPGDVKEVPGIISSANFIRVADDCDVTRTKRQYTRHTTKPSIDNDTNLTEQQSADKPSEETE